jgi:hypothetical protein
MMTNAYSVYLKDKQSHLYIDYVNSLYSILDRLRQKYQHLPVMLCSGEGSSDVSEGRRFGPSESGKSYSGDYLMNIGLNIGTGTPLTSTVFEITE